MTNAERIASIPEKLRRKLIRENANGKGVGMKTLAQRYRIPEKTVRVVIYASKHPDAEPAPRRPAVCAEWEALILPGWQCHGELTPDQARVYPKIDAPSKPLALAGGDD